MIISINYGNSRNISLISQNQMSKDPKRNDIRVIIMHNKKVSSYFLLQREGNEANQQMD